jgi:type II restriction enzyme
MIFLDFYKNVLNCKTEDEVFNYILNTLKPSDRLWSYFVNWEKVFKNTKKTEIALNNLNYLIGKKDFDNEFRFLIKQNPEIVKVIPFLAVRDGLNK